MEENVDQPEMDCAKEQSKKKPKTLLGSLPWRDRLRIGAKALWTLCPTSLQGALAWAALGPVMLLALRVMAAVDPAKYFVQWGSLGISIVLWLPALALAAVFLPALRGARALRAGGKFPEYSNALRGRDPASGAPAQASLEDWSWFLWLWLFSVGGSWLDERNLRSGGAVISHSLAWHAMNTARVEVCAIIFLTVALAWLAKMGVYRGPSLREPHPAPDWSKLRGASSGLAAGASHWWSQCAAQERSRWDKLKDEGAGSKAWLKWWAGAPFPLRAGAMSFIAVWVCWLGAYGFNLISSDIWVTNIVSRMTWGKFIFVWTLSAILIRLVSRRPGAPEKSALWHGPQGPSMSAWLLLAAVGSAVDMVSAHQMDRGSMCSQGMLAGEGYFAVVMGWVIVVWAGDVLGWAGGHLERWSQEARLIGGFAPVAFGKLFWAKAKSSWIAAGAARVQLSDAMERRALENEADLARSLRKELADSIPETPRKSRGSSRL